MSRSDGDWGMCSPECEDILSREVSTLLTLMESANFHRHELEPRYGQILRRLKVSGHPEVYAPKVRRRICDVVDASCDKRGWRRIYE